MSCFIHHMIRKGIFYDLDIPVSEENAEEMEEKITAIVGMKGKDCAQVWAKVRKWLDDPNLREVLRKKLSPETKTSASTLLTPKFN